MYLSPNQKHMAVFDRKWRTYSVYPYVDEKRAIDALNAKKSEGLDLLWGSLDTPDTENAASLVKARLPECQRVKNVVYGE